MPRSFDQLFTRCHILHVEPNFDYSKTIGGMLLRNGAASVVHVTSCAKVNRQNLNRKTDIVLLDHDKDFKAAEALVRKIRRVETGADPFVAIFATQSTASEQAVRKEKSAGFDGILLKPFSLDVFFAHVENVANSDRRFVVSKAYIGPDRREKNRTDSRSKVYPAPNRLKLKMTGEIVATDVTKWRKFWQKKLAGPEYFDV